MAVIARAVRSHRKSRRSDSPERPHGGGDTARTSMVREASRTRRFFVGAMPPPAQTKVVFVVSFRKEEDAQDSA